MSTSAGFGTFVYNQGGLTATSQTVSGLSQGTIYYWRVNATNSTGTSGWSTVWAFTTQSSPPPCGTSYAAASSFSLDQVAISDAHGHSQSLFIDNEARPLMNRVGIINDQMPPEPQAGAFSVRFQADRFVEHVPADRTTVTIPILIRDASFPITLSWNFHAENAVTYWLVHHGGQGTQLGDSGSTQIEDHGNGNSGNGNTVVTLQANSVDPCLPQKTAHSGAAPEVIGAKPSVYSLDENYPNPFNPSTEVRYTLPEDAHLTLKIYDVLGREVTTLVDEFEHAGYKSVTFDGTNFASGLYFYRLHAKGKFTDTKKMMLVK
ncbi:MAG: T9SS type A sorting domain-containing protein [Ignavibacteriae bacterium]|nr:T9SS type A sorting domain-containing protein [Ignavibacteriota bacterium]